MPGLGLSALPLATEAFKLGPVPGAVELSGDNTYAGGTVIVNGRLVLRSNTAAGHASGTIELRGREDALGPESVLQLADGVNIENDLDVVDNFDHKYLQLEAGADSAEYSGDITMEETANNSFVINTNGGELTLSGVISGTAINGDRNTISIGGNDSTLILEGDNTFKGDIRVKGDRSKLVVAHNDALSSHSTSDVKLADSDTVLELANMIVAPTNSRLLLFDTGNKKTLQVSAGAEATFSGGIEIAETGAGNFEVNSNGGTLRIAGPITNTGAAGLTKVGGGRLVLENSVDLGAGLLTVEEGSVFLQNTYNGGDIVIDPGAMFGASGTITADILNDGIISPGNSPGSLAVGSTSLGTYLWEMLDADDVGGVAGTDWDLLTVNGVLTVNPGDGILVQGLVSEMPDVAGLPANLDISTVGAVSGPFDILTLGPTASVDFTTTGLGSLADIPLNFGNLGQYGSFTAQFDIPTDTLQLVFTSTVPEPGTWAIFMLLCVSGAFFCWYRREAGRLPSAK